MSGLELRVRQVAGAPVVAVRVYLRGGALAEEVPGQALVTGRGLAEGTAERSWEAIAEGAEALGMALHSSGGGETIGVAVDALAGDWEEALRVAAELVFEPAFPAERLAWLRRQAAAELDALLDQPDARSSLAFADQLYRPHPYGRPLFGDAASLVALDAGAVAAFHRRSLAWGGLVTVAGALDEDAVASRAGDLFAPLATAAERPPPAPAPAGSGEPRREVEVEAGDSDQAHLFVGQLTVPRGHDDGAALDLLAVVLGAGAGLAGRLPERIREREGLAYAVDVGCAAGAGLGPGRLSVYVGTGVANVARAERAVREELARVLDDGLTDAELADARAYLLGREPLRRQTARQWVDLMADAALYRLPFDDPAWIRDRLLAPDRATVEAAARRWIRPEELVTTVGVPSAP